MYFPPRYNIFLKNAFKNVVCKMTAILLRLNVLINWTLFTAWRKLGLLWIMPRRLKCYPKSVYYTVPSLHSAKDLRWREAHIPNYDVFLLTDSPTEESIRIIYSPYMTAMWFTIYAIVLPNVLCDFFKAIAFAEYNVATAVVVHFVGWFSTTKSKLEYNCSCAIWRYRIVTCNTV